jgi:hypothetical protein
VTVIKPNEVASATVAKAGEINSTEATRAALRRTLQQGVGFASSSESSSPPERGAGELFEQARRVAALADTQQDLTRPPPGSTQPPRASRNPKLARTLRMDLKVPPSEEPPPAEVVSSNPPAAGRSSPRPHIPTQHGVPLPPIPPSDFASTRPNFSVGPQTRPAEGTAPFDPSGPRSYSYDPSTTGPRLSSPAPPALPRKRPLRPGERTMVLSRRVPARKDWLFVVLVVGALGVTASMLLSYRSSGEEESAEAVPEEEEVLEDPSLQPSAPEQAQPASSGVRATELRSDPPGAEVVVNGAVVGNTPVRVARSESDMDYTLRLPGFESKVVRVGSQSPATIAVTLRPNNPAAPLPK